MGSLIFKRCVVIDLLISIECFFHDSDRKNHPIRITDKQASVTIELHPLYVGQALPILEEILGKGFQTFS